jgi:hypothetical protein
VSGGDFHGDELPDLIALDDANKLLSIWLGDGGGTFSPTMPSLLVDPESVWHIGVGDFDDDGRDDVAVVYWSKVLIYPADGNGGLDLPTTHAFPGDHDGGNAIAVGEVDGIGGIDIVIGAYDTGTIGVMLNDGLGSFAEAIVYQTAAGGSSDGPTMVRVAEVNQDPLIDVVSNDIDKDGIYVHLGAGVPLLEPGAEIDGGAWGGFALADFDDDCGPDLVAHYNDGGVQQIRVRLNLTDGSGDFAPATVLDYAGGVPRAVEIGDFDGDGVPDIAVANPSQVWVFSSDP